MNTQNPTPAADMAVEARVAELMQLIDEHGQSRWDTGWDERGDNDKTAAGHDKAAVAIRAQIEDALRAALARPQEVAEPVKEKIAPVQGYTPGIPWSLHLEAYDAYRKRWSPQPALIDLEGRNCRGGFGVAELDEFIPGWRDRVSEIGRLKAEISRLTEALAASRAPVAVGVEPTRWHELKTDPDSFDAVMRGDKTCEIRRNDRDFKVGDGLLLRRTKYTGAQMHMRPETCPLEYTGEECRRVVSHVLTGYMLDNYCALSFATPSPGAGGSVGAAKQRAAELHEKASMPWEQAVELALSEQGISLPLYQAVNKLVCQIGYEGSIDADHALVLEVMDALHDLDGGTSIATPAPEQATPAPSVPLGGGEVAVSLEQVEALARTMWRGEAVPGRVLRFGAAVLGLADAAPTFQAQDAAPVEPITLSCQTCGRAEAHYHSTGSDGALKTSVLPRVAQIWREQGLDVTSFPPSALVAQILRDSAPVPPIERVMGEACANCHGSGTGMDGRPCPFGPHKQVTYKVRAAPVPAGVQGDAARLTVEDLTKLAKANGAFSAGDYRGLILWENMGAHGDGLFGFALAAIASQADKKGA